MKTTTRIMIIGLVAGMSFWPCRTKAELEVSASVQISATADFHVPLAAHGAWVEVGSYGRCWRPSGVIVGWQPYCEGHWVWTDCGWYWESDEPWAWATYHYGTWVYEGPYGWVWVPGIEWAPAWVEWRVGGGYCGWAPCAPRGVVVFTGGFVFVESRRFHEPVRHKTVIINNTTIINKTKIVGGQRQESRNVAGSGSRKVVVNEGPSVESVQQASGKSFTRVAINDADSKTKRPPEVMRKQPGADKRDDGKRDIGEKSDKGAPAAKERSPAEQPRGKEKDSITDKPLGPAPKERSPAERPEPGPGKPNITDKDKDRDEPPGKGKEVAPGPRPPGPPGGPNLPGKPKPSNPGKSKGKGGGDKDHGKGRL